MRLPKRPPSFTEVPEPAALSNLMGRILRKEIGPTVEGKYLHWDELRFRTPPEGLTREQWWWGIKWQRRSQSREVPLISTSGRPFTFALVDPLPEYLHQIDQRSGGTIRLPEPVTNPETRDQYLVRSLIEEAFTSSQIEGAGTTREAAKQIIREGRAPRDRGERMVWNNYQTMERILSLGGEELSRDLVFEIHRMVTEGTLPDATAAGRFRRSDEPIVVGDHIGEVDYHVPPPASELAERLEKMCAFANERSPGSFIHPVIRAMILHFWLAYDHPFVDGNGRTARALFYWSMLRHDYWLFEYISISHAIYKAPIKYERAFLYTETDENDLTYFLLYHVDVIVQAVEALHEYIEKRSQRLRSLAAELRGMEGLNHRQRELIQHAVRHPGFHYTVESHRRSHRVVTQTARTDLLGLVDRGLLHTEKVGRVLHFLPVPDLEEKLRGAVEPCRVRCADRRYPRHLRSAQRTLQG